MSRRSTSPVRLRIYILRQDNPGIQADGHSVAAICIAHSPPSDGETALDDGPIQRAQCDMNGTIEHVLKCLVGGIISLEEEGAGR